MNCAEKLLEPTTKDFRFGKSLVQERFKSNLEFRCQIIVSSIKIRNGFAKFMIPIPLFKKFLSKQFIWNVEVSKMAKCASKIE